ncbi:metalloregulator ArsR/SmtB family transcription factor [Chitinimonas sp. BJYL2]|uniref:helix-turn-helix transcriptional regulator n=1 Tax=Chitinimonas sp. BJYL2 TaxID=2976696 RepID=UPI0022B52554|nr:metalloregulator ArsR/SmtB family transcription factor [Chitinimonas sp. BJYL2]
MNTAERVLYLLKTRGPQTAQQLSELLALSSMAVRRHLEGAQERGLLLSEDRNEGVGRPARYWLLSDAGHARFPDRHGDLTVALLAQVQQLFGEAGLSRLIAAREQEAERDYLAATAGAASLAGKIEALAQQRTREGYMAEVESHPEGWLLAENHCPICAAAQQCQGFCRSELALFQRVIGDAGTVVRTEHLLGGARRCVYLIKPVT